MKLKQLRSLLKRQQRNYARSGSVYDYSKTTGSSWVTGQPARDILEKLHQEIKALT